jgi:hypothetical protein
MKLSNTKLFGLSVCALCCLSTTIIPALLGAGLFGAASNGASASVFTIGILLASGTCMLAWIRQKQNTARVARACCETRPEKA